MPGGDDQTKDIPVLKPDQPLALPGETQPGLDQVSRKLYESASPAVVQIVVNGKAIDYPDQRSYAGGKGSGFYVDDKGTVVTDAHVVLGGREIFVVDKSGKRFKAQIERMDDINDLAVLKTIGQKDQTPFLKLADSSVLKADTPVWALGHPQGLRPAYISPGYYRHQSNKLTELMNINQREAEAFVRDVSRSKTPAELSELEATLKRTMMHGRVHIEQGNSGGPLVDKDGTVVGVSDQVARDDYSMSYYNRVEDLSNLLSDKNPPKFKFSYAYEPSGWAQQHIIDWKNDQGMAIASLGIGAGSTYVGYRLINRFPKLGLGVGLIGSMNAINDASNFVNSTDSRDSWKYGLSTLADLTTIGGAVATVVPKAKTLGLVTMGVGFVGRLATDFIPNHLVGTDVQRTDGSYRPPFNIERQLDIR